jgi:hypothetical protein
MKRVLRGFCAVLGCAAAGVFFFVPLSVASGLVCMGAVFVGVCCLLAWSKLDEDGEIPALWPPRNHQK